MQKTNNKSGKVYNTLEELLFDNPLWITEIDGDYYVCPSPPGEEVFYNAIYKVNKSTHKAEYMMYTKYVTDGLFEKAEPVDIIKLKNEIKSG